ncbi:MAG: hypothetical protein GX804_11625 [Lentisphaerae bacterium]|jgi:predicted RNA-binding Zn-ribbon protein involved in translation (DUF1610 family)|nr:hypothetical protein [Lentisphaerota bacterium]
MPAINDYKCDNCGFCLPSGWGGYMYVIDDDGKRIVCPHPREFATVAEVLGDDAPPELVELRTGFNSYCLCLECLKKVELDLDRDLRECPKCTSNNITSLSELVGHSCPKCKEGTIKEIETGMWT